MANKLTDRLLKNKKFKDYVVSGEEVPKTFYHTGSITLNLLLSGKVDGGVMGNKISLFAAPRAHFKSILATIAAANAQRKGELVVWVDSEFALDIPTAKMFGMSTDEDKFLLIQDNSIENVRGMIMNLFEDYDKANDPKVFMVVDSIGTMITSKTINDALDNADKADMTVSKKRNDLSKLILRVSGIHKVTVVMIAHVYEDMSTYSTGAIGGGSGVQYVSSSILKITSKRKEKGKDGDIEGNIFTAYTDKGRMAKENSKLTFLASYEDGVNAWYGLLDDALEGGYVIKPSMGFYSRPCVEGDKKWRESQIYNKDFWVTIFKETDFKNYLETKYSYNNTMSEEDKVYDTSLDLE